MTRALCSTYWRNISYIFLWKVGTLLSLKGVLRARPFNKSLKSVVCWGFLEFYSSVIKWHFSNYLKIVPRLSHHARFAKCYVFHCSWRWLSAPEICVRQEQCRWRLDPVRSLLTAVHAFEEITQWQILVTQTTSRETGTRCSPGHRSYRSSGQCHHVGLEPRGKLPEEACILTVSQVTRQFQIPQLQSMHISILVHFVILKPHSTYSYLNNDPISRVFVGGKG